MSDIESIADQVILLKDHQVIGCSTVEETCQTLRGKVYETHLTEREWDEFQLNHLVLGEKQEEGGFLVRYAGEPGQPGKVVAPNLEDVFLYLYQDEGKQA